MFSLQQPSFNPYNASLSEHKLCGIYIYNNLTILHIHYMSYRAYHSIHAL